MALNTTNTTTDERLVTGIEIQALLSPVNLLCIIFSQIIFFALRKTRHSPLMARFLVCSAIEFHCLLVLLCLFRKFFTSLQANIVVMTTLLGITDIMVVNVTIIAVERLIGFRYPFFYRQYLMKRRAKCFVIGLWILAAANVAPFVKCNQELRDETNLNVETCVTETTWIRLVLFITCFMLMISCTVYIVIFITLKGREYGLEKKAKHYKLSMALLLSGLNFFVISIALKVLCHMPVDFITRSVVFECCIMLNGVIDTTVYVMWFPECRLELLKFLVVCFPKLERKIEQMRLQVFQIVLPEKKPEEKIFSSISGL